MSYEPIGNQEDYDQGYNDALDTVLWYIDYSDVLGLDGLTSFLEKERNS